MEKIIQKIITELNLDVSIMTSMSGNGIRLIGKNKDLNTLYKELAKRTK